jgi:Pregnancy-associated plasma protein-A
MRKRISLHAGVLTAVIAAAVLAGEAASGVGGLAAAASPGVAACSELSGLARVKDATAAEPELYAKNQANAYGVLKDQPTLANGSVTIPVVFHMVGGDPFTAVETARWTTMIADQIDVLNDSFAGLTGPGAADTPFRFQLVKTTWTVNAEWFTVVPGKAGVEKDMKQALYEGDARTLNVYAADIGGGLLGWAYFPKGYNNGRDFIDGVVILDESMPGGTAGTNAKYGLGDTLTHEVGHWLMLEHTFAHGCSASGDWVVDTPSEAIPQFNCPADDTDTCVAPGFDPIHNFMDYTQDSCMWMFTQGQADRMSDAWLQFRAGGGKSNG